MTIKPLILTAFEITDAPALDPIRVFLQYFGNGQGRLVIECFGQAWSNYWGAMGTDTRDFIINARPEYIQNALQTGQKTTKKDRGLHELSEAERSEMGLRRLELADLDKECHVEKGSYLVIPFYERTKA